MKLIERGGTHQHQLFLFCASAVQTLVPYPYSPPCTVFFDQFWRALYHGVGYTIVLIIGDENGNGVAGKMGAWTESVGYNWAQGRQLVAWLIELNSFL